MIAPVPPSVPPYHSSNPSAASSSPCRPMPIIQTLRSAVWLTTTPSIHLTLVVHGDKACFSRSLLADGDLVPPARTSQSDNAPCPARSFQISRCRSHTPYSNTLSQLQEGPLAMALIVSLDARTIARHDVINFAAGILHVQ